MTLTETGNRNQGGWQTFGPNENTDIYEEILNIEGLHGHSNMLWRIR